MGFYSVALKGAKMHLIVDPSSSLQLQYYFLGTVTTTGKLGRIDGHCPVVHVFFCCFFRGLEEVWRTSCHNKTWIHEVAFTMAKELMHIVEHNSTYHIVVICRHIHNIHHECQHFNTSH